MVATVLSDEEIEAELAYLPDRWTIEVAPVTDWDESAEEESGSRLVKVTTPLRAEIAATFAINFKRETDFDNPPFAAADLARDGLTTYLFSSREFMLAFPVASGAASIFQASVGPVLTWAWLHPFERAQFPEAWTNLWTQMEQKHPGLLIEAPLSPPMRAWVERHGLGGRLARHN